MGRSSLAAPKPEPAGGEQGSHPHALIINRDAANAFLQSKQWPVVGHGLLKYLSENRDSLNLRDEKLAVQDPSVAYYSRDEPAGETMDNIAAETVDKQRRAHAAMDRFNSR
ncbi:hypothetical protein [Rhizobacter sp. Root1221]|uniref:hypothetical protein n=1 Tax=Rhizobacter sp. Root1221 TaxID=1736433 RepID=UPI0006F34D01|nr:hypothetical protein [Rhizobacter sp. Root1221]KQV85416.1 hypothetical protein ASC87_06920 [Rhizobacter sp. Root1221]